ncbi:MAG: DDE-type integrase/transposase/recombinase [Nitrospirota bacterium]
MARKKWSAEEKQKMVLAGLRNEASVAELCRQYGVSDVMYYKWKKAFLEVRGHSITGRSKEQMQVRQQYLHKPEGINQLWQVDFTEFQIPEYGTYYSTNVLDYFSRYVLACLIRASYTADDLIDALEMAKQEAQSILGEDCFPEKVLLVSDQGPAMKSKTFRKYLQGSIFRHVLARGHHPQTMSSRTQKIPLD